MAPKRIHPVASSKPPLPTEHFEQCMLMQWAHKHRTQYPELTDIYAVPNGGYILSKVAAQKLKQAGLKKGVPDLCLPHARQGYHGLYIEMKRRARGVVSPEQKDWHQRLSAAGHKVIVCKGWEVARDEIINYLTNNTSGDNQ